MSGSVESQRQIQLTFQDKSTDKNLSVEVTRESWLNEVQAELQNAGGATAGGATHSAATAGAPVWDEPAPRAEEQPVPTPQEASGVEGQATSSISFKHLNGIAEGFAVVEEVPEKSAEIAQAELAMESIVNEDAEFKTPVDHSPSVDDVQVQVSDVTQIDANEASLQEELTSAPDNAVIDHDDVHPREELDFGAEPLPEPLTEASSMITTHLGSLTLPAALCDDQLLEELASIPEKMGFKIGEVAELLGIKQYVLRYWETEFDVLKPKKAANNQRYYTKKDVENVYLIRKLLHRDRFSIEGARAALKDLKSVVKKEKDWSQVNNRVEAMNERVDHLIVDLRKLRQLFAD